MRWLEVFLSSLTIGGAAARGGSQPLAETWADSIPQEARPPRAAPRAAVVEPPAAIIARVNIARAEKRSNAAGPSLEVSEEKAVKAEQKAAAALQEIQVISAENNAIVPLVAGQAAEAKVALKTAQDSVAEAEQIIADTDAATKAAALQAASDYLAEVKTAGAEATKASAAARAAAESKAEVVAAKAAAKAAEPYHVAISRGQKVVHEYMTQAQQDAAASNALKYQAIQLNSAAGTYQFMNHPVEAAQIRMQADELMRDGQRYKDEALHLQKVAGKIEGLVPAYYAVANEAAAQAFADAQGKGIPEVDLPYLLQVGRLHRALRGPSLVTSESIRATA